MKKLLYFSDGNGANATGEATSVLAENICTIVPLAVSSTLMYYRNTHNTIDSVKFAHDDTTATTGHRVKDIARAIAEAANAGPHTNGMVDVADMDNSIFYGNLSFITGVNIYKDTQIDF